MIAETEAAAEDGAALVMVDDEPLPAVLDLEAAMASGAAPSRLTNVAGGGDGGAGAHGAGGGSDGAGDAPDSPNVASFARLRGGDVEAALSRADAVVSGHFRTNWIDQAYLEPQSCLAWVDPDGTLVVHSSTQGAFMARQGLADMLGLALDRVRVQAAPLGGAFGGKLMISEPLAAAAAFKLRRPVRIVFQRTEDFAAANPAPGQLLELELGATADGTLTGIRGRIVGDRGGLGEMGVEAISTNLSSGPYNWQAHDLTAIGVTTNRVSAGAYRAPGAPPAAFAVESLIDRLADELGLDPIELRLKNVLQAGDAGLDGQESRHSFGARECLEAVRAHPLWARRYLAPGRRGDRRRDRLLAGRARARGRDLPARCRRQADRRHRRLGHERDRERVHRDRERYVRARRGRRPRRRPATPSSAPVRRRRRRLARSLTRTDPRSSAPPPTPASGCWTWPPSELEIAPEDLELVDGEVRPVGAPGRAVRIADLAAKTYTFGAPHRPDRGSRRRRAGQPRARAPRRTSHTSASTARPAP